MDNFYIRSLVSLLCLTLLLGLHYLAWKKIGSDLPVLLYIILLIIGWGITVILDAARSGILP